VATHVGGKKGNIPIDLAIASKELMPPIPFSNSYLGNIVGHPLDNDICGQSRNCHRRNWSAELAGDCI
jgi:hypothetical protein